MIRRWFARNVFEHCAVSVVVNVYLIGAPMIELRGDGVHDDTLGIQAYLRGEAVRAPSGEILQLPAELPPGTYLIAKPLVYAS